MQLSARTHSVCSGRGEFTCIARMCALPVVAREAAGCFCLVTNLELASGERAYACTLGSVITSTGKTERRDGEMLTAVPQDHRSPAAVLMSAQLIIMAPLWFILMPNTPIGLDCDAVLPSPQR